MYYSSLCNERNRMRDIKTIYNEYKTLITFIPEYKKIPTSKLMINWLKITSNELQNEILQTMLINIFDTSTIY